MFTRRQFLGALGVPAAAVAGGAFLNPRKMAEACEVLTDPSWQDTPPSQLAADEARWGPIQTAFTVDRSLINFNNGGVSPAPQLVQAAMKRHLDSANTAPTRVLWQIQ